MQEGRPISVFDIDGTLSSCQWRRHLVEEAQPRWKEFFELMGADAPVSSVVAALEHRLRSGHEIILVSARPESFRYQTEFWLSEHAIGYHRLLMRATRDQRRDDLVKQDILLNKIADLSAIAEVYDDSTAVIAMWRSHGLTVHEVTDPGLPPLLDRN